MLTRTYLSDSERFAELFNTFVFKGRHVADKNKLKAETPLEEVHFRKSRRSVKKERDLLKTLQIMSDGEKNYLLLGIENQLGIHYAMPVRTMIYDAVEYGRQIQKRTAKHKAGSFRNADEFLSGFGKNEKLIPVFTLVVYWGEEKWDGPLSLGEMFSKSLMSRYGEYIQDYRLNLLDLNDIPDEIMDTLQTDLKKVLYFRKYSKNPARLRELLSAENSMYKSVAKDAAALLKELTGADIEIPPEGGNVNMCEAIDYFVKERSDIVRKETEARVRKETEARVRKETEAADIRNTFEMFSRFAPSVSHEEIIQMIADQFKMDAGEVRKIVIS